MGVIHRNDQLRRVQDTIAAWVDGSDYRVSRLEFENDALRIEIAGSGRVPSAAILDDDLADAGVELDELSLAVVEEHRILHG